MTIILGEHGEGYTLSRVIVASARSPHVGWNINLVFCTTKQSALPAQL